VRLREHGVDVMRRRVAIERTPLFEGVSASALTKLAERADDRQVHRGERVVRVPHALQVFPGGAASLGPQTPDYLPHVPELASSLAGVPFRHEIRAKRDDLVVVLSMADVALVLEEEFSLWLALARALAERVVGAKDSLRIADALARLGRVPPASHAPLDLMARVRCLRAALPFAHERVCSLVQLARHAVELRADDGVELWREGDPSDTALIVVAGEVGARMRSGDGFTLGPGAVIGGFDAIARRRRWFTAAARGAVVALTLSVERFLDVLEDEHELAHDVLVALAQALLIARNPDGAKPVAS
jgi:CRP-like cAMP-binding protein